MDAELQIDSKYFRNGLIVDTNILLLLFVGTYNRALIGRLKRVSTFTHADYDLLVSMLSKFSNIVITPMIATEVSNLSNSLESRHKPKYYDMFAQLAGKMVEETRPTKEIVATDTFKRFGYTDTAISLIAAQQYLVLTDDFTLYGYLNANGITSVNFNHVRQMAGVL